MFINNAQFFVIKLLEVDTPGPGGRIGYRSCLNRFDRAPIKVDAAEITALQHERQLEATQRAAHGHAGLDIAAHFYGAKSKVLQIAPAVSPPETIRPVGGAASTSWSASCASV